MGVIYFNGISSKDLGIEVETFPKYEIPEKEVTKYEIPGRNGEIVIDHGTFKNVNVEYDISVLVKDGDYNSRLHAIASWLYSPSGYARLEDSYDSECYRMARISSNTSFENLFNQAGKATLTFDCKPQRFLKKGEEQIEYNKADSHTTLINPSFFSAKPLLKLCNIGMASSAGTISNIGLNGYIFKVNEIINALNQLPYPIVDVIIDFENKKAYYRDVTDYSKRAELPTNGVNKLFARDVTLDKGENIIVFKKPTSSNSFMKLTPRWWML